MRNLYCLNQKKKKIKRIDKNGEKLTKNISHELQIIDSTGFMGSLLSNLVNNLSEGIHIIKCKYKKCDKRCKKK